MNAEQRPQSNAEIVVDFLKKRKVGEEIATGKDSPTVENLHHSSFNVLMSYLVRLEYLERPRVGVVKVTKRFKEAPRKEIVEAIGAAMKKSVASSQRRKKRAPASGADATSTREGSPSSPARVTVETTISEPEIDPAYVFSELGLPGILYHLGVYLEARFGRLASVDMLGEVVRDLRNEIAPRSVLPAVSAPKDLGAQFRRVRVRAT